MTISPFVTIIVLQYSNSSDTVKCLDSLVKIRYPNFKVLVVDNGSNQTEQDIIKKYLKNSGHSHWPLIHNQANLGYAGGNNVGIKRALSEGADYIFILNNDTTIEPDALDKLVAAAEAEPTVGLVGPAIKEPERTVYYGKISWLKTELEHVAAPSATQHLKLKEYLPGAALLIKRKVIEKIDDFDEIFFLYFEDADFCFRAQLDGFKLKSVPEALVSHYVSRSTEQLGSLLLLRYHVRNALIFNSLNAPWTIKPFLIFWAVYLLLKNLLKSFVFSQKEPEAEAIMNGIGDFYKNKFGEIKD